MMQIDLFQAIYPTFKFDQDKTLRLVHLFSGIGFVEIGMKLAEIPFKTIATSEIDKFAIESYCAIHGDTDNLGSVIDVKGKDIPNDIDILAYGFPCTDLSIAGQQKGFDGTRSGLVYEVLRILQELKELDNLPKVLIMENVTALIHTNFIQGFQEIQLELEALGYTNYTDTLNAKDYGIAQNRDRVFMVSILGEYNYNFPKGFELEHRLKDYLEEEVDEKYYLSDKMVNFFKENSRKNEEKGNGFRFSPTEGNKEAKTITTLAGNRMDDNFIKEPKILMPEATKQGYKEAYEGDGVYLNRPHQKRGVVQDGMIQTLKTSGNDVGVVVNAKKELCNKLIEQGLVEEMDMIRHSYTNNRMEDLDRKEGENNISATLTTRPDTLGVVVSGLYLHDSERFAKEPLEGLSRTLKANKHDSAALIEDVKQSLRIRKLTPVETGRLMGMNDEQINKQLEVVSNSQAYKQHGNGIVAQVIGLIIGMLVYDDEIELRNMVMKNSHTWLGGR